MNKHISLICFICILPIFHSSLSAQDNVGIGILNPAFRLDVQGDPASSLLTNVNSKVNYVGLLDIKAFEGYSVTSDGFGLGGKFTGGYRGMEGIGMGGTYAGTAYGIFGNATGSTGTRIGVYGTSSGGTANYGLYGVVSGGAGNYGVFGQNTNISGYAGYFNGRGHFTQELRADRNLVVDDTTWTTRIWNQGGIMGMRSVSDIELMIDRNDNPGLTAAFEIFKGNGGHVFLVSETGNSHSYGNHVVDDRLGVGTTSPTTKIQVLGGNDVSLTGLGFMQNGPTTGQNLILDDNEIMVRNNGAAADMFIQHDAGNLLLCGQEQGGVGIGVLSGTSIPAGYLIAVDGRIIAEELRIQNSSNWPDYVFSESYDLMPLDVLKQSIRDLNHLPNIPSAAEVEQDGILVGDMQKRLMEKIEELTLYILELHETNIQQQSEIENLKEIIHSIKKD